MTEGRRAVEEAVTPDMLAAAMRKCALLALQGNLAAMRILFERTLGRPADVPAGEPLDIEPLRLRNATDCTAALQRVTDAMCQGRLDLLQGKVLIDAIATQSKLIDVSNLEERLAELERMVATVDLGGRR